MSSQQLHINQSVNAANYYYHRELANWTLTNCTHCWAIFHFYTNHTNSHSIQSPVELCVSRPEQTHRKKRKTYTDIYQWSNSSTSAPLPAPDTFAPAAKQALIDYAAYPGDEAIKCPNTIDEDKLS